MERLQLRSIAACGVTTGEEALALIRHEPFDVVLLDVKMPDMDGFEVLDRMADLEYRPPVIVISGHGTIETAVAATKLGAFDFLVKPPDEDHLLLVLKKTALGLQVRAVSQNRSMAKAMKRSARSKKPTSFSARLGL